VRVRVRLFASVRFEPLSTRLRKKHRSDTNTNKDDSAERERKEYMMNQGGLAVGTTQRKDSSSATKETLPAVVGTVH
jgi:hypothetical protein